MIRVVPVPNTFICTEERVHKTKEMSLTGPSGCCMQQCPGTTVQLLFVVRWYRQDICNTIDYILIATLQLVQDSSISVN